MLKKFSAASEENARIAQEDLFGVENSLKAFKGYESGLIDKSLMAKKAAEENQLRQAVAADPTEKAEFGDPWAEIANAMDVRKADLSPAQLISSGAAAFAAIWPAMPAFWCARAEELPSPMATACANIAIRRCPRSSRIFFPPRRFTNRSKR